MRGSTRPKAVICPVLCGRSAAARQSFALVAGTLTIVACVLAGTLMFLHATHVGFILAGSS